MADNFDDLFIKIKLLIEQGESPAALENLIKQVGNLQGRARGAEKVLASLFEGGTISAKQYVDAMEQVVAGLSSVDAKAKQVNKTLFSQAKARVAGLFTNEDFMSGIGDKARAEQQRFNQVLSETPTIAERAHKGLLSFSNFMRTAFGTLTAIAIFTVLTSVQKFFSGVLQAASQFRSEIAELNLAESVLSKKGMDITRQEFDDMIAYIEGRSQYLSKLEVTKVVADTAGAVQEFDVTKEQLGELADAIAFIQVKNKLLGREEADAAHIINAAMDARSNFFNGMGINITEAIIKEKAYAMGLVKAGEEIDKATRFQAILALLTEQTADKQEELNRQLEGTPLGNQLKLQKEWADVQLRVGNSLVTVRDNLVNLLTSFSPDLANSVIGFFDSMTISLNSFIDALDRAKAGWDSLASVMDGTNLEAIGDSFGDWAKNLADMLAPFEIVLSLLQGLGAIIATGVAGMVTLFAELANGVKIKQAFFDAGINAGKALIDGMSTSLTTLLRGESGVLATKIKQAWKDAFGVDLDAQPTITQPTITAPDTPTVPGDVSSVMEEEQSDLQKALEKMNNEILEAQIKLAQDMEDAAIDLGRKLVDIAEEYAKKRADAERDYANKVRDINESYRSKISDIRQDEAESNAKARSDELEREAEFQNKMLELKENYLMDLEEALHERDARQVLRLMKQYNLDKTQAERDHALDNESAARDLALEKRKFARARAEAEAERKAKLAEALRDYQDKLIQLKADEEAEKRAAQRAYERKMQDLDREMKNRLELIGAHLVQEFNLTEAGLKRVYRLYELYYGQFSRMYASMMSMLYATPQLGGAWASGGITYNSTGNRAPIIGSAGGQRFAEGGSMIADRPTTVTFGEAGLEMAQFTPIGRTGRDTNKLFSNMSSKGDGQSTSNIGLEVILSPDLEARVVNNALNGAANIITKVRKSKVR